MRYINQHARRGITLTELLIASTLALIIGAILVSTLFMNLSGQRITLSYNANTRATNDALQRIVYGWADNRGLREAAEVTVANYNPGWKITYDDGDYLTYLPVEKRIEDQNGVVYAHNVTDSYVRENLNAVGITLGIKVQADHLKKPTAQAVETSIVYRNALFD